MLQQLNMKRIPLKLMKMLTGSVFTHDDLVEIAKVMQKLKKG